jgi:hypothetical protein
MEQAMFFLNPNFLKVSAGRMDGGVALAAEEKLEEGGSDCYTALLQVAPPRPHPLLPAERGRAGLERGKWSPPERGKGKASDGGTACPHPHRYFVQAVTKTPSPMRCWRSLLVPAGRIALEHAGGSGRHPADILPPVRGKFAFLTGEGCPAAAAVPRSWWGEDVVLGRTRERLARFCRLLATAFVTAATSRAASVDAGTCNPVGNLY